MPPDLRPSAADSSGDSDAPRPVHRLAVSCLTLCSAAALAAVTSVIQALTMVGSVPASRAAR